MYIKKYEHLKDLVSIEKQWDQIAANCSAIPMQDYIWLVSSSEVIPDDVKQFFLSISSDTGLQAIAPIISRPGFVNTYELLCVSSLWEPSDFVYANSTALEYLLKTIMGFQRPFELRRVREDSLSVSTIQRIFKGKAIVIKSELNAYPYIKLGSKNNDSTLLLSSRLRSDLRRAQRKAESAGVISFEIYMPHSEEEFLPLYEEALRAESSGWKGRSGSAISQNKAQQMFFRNYGIRAAKKGILRLAFLRIDSECAAMQFAIQESESFWLLKIGYNEKFKSCSPGNLLMYETLRYAEQQGLRSYEFLGTSQAWTKRWTTLTRRTVRINIYPFNLPGLLSLIQLYAYKVQVKIFRKLRFNN